jgi:hypothetical protein
MLRAPVPVRDYEKLASSSAVNNADEWVKLARDGHEIS